jgi:1-phosphatidylinositol-3-phosphate 5-kinase
MCVSIEDRFLTTLSSQSSTSSTHLQLPTPPEVLAEQSIGGPPELDTASGSEGIP